jgi:hypothetical protein
MPGSVLRQLHALWRAREGRDEYIGTLINAYLAAGGEAIGVRAGNGYVDVGTFGGYRAAIGLLSRMTGETFRNPDIASLARNHGETDGVRNVPGKE